MPLDFGKYYSCTQMQDCIMKENWMLLLVVRMTSFLEVNWSFIQWLGTKCIEIGVGWGGLCLACLHLLSTIPFMLK